MMLLVLAGAQTLIDWLPEAAAVLRWLGVAWLLWMALQLVRSSSLSPGEGLRAPRVWESALLQWANPKAWMVISGTAAAWRGIAVPGWLDALLLAALFAGSCALALVLWAVGGERLARWLQAGQRLIWFNRLHGLSLAITAAWLAAA
jgi:threonine/homoserine/homoserine lactone efflux protein